MSPKIVHKDTWTAMKQKCSQRQSLSILCYLQLMCVLIWSSASPSWLFVVTPEVPCLFSVNIWSCYPDCKVPSSPQEQTNSISPCQSAAPRESKLSAETNRDRQHEKEMQEEEADKQRRSKREREADRDG